ncbi:MAG: cytochrome c oxidase accessory protein CcoG [Pirellulaceae bacterium]|nr:cytochrome c oxidase accessory protein CcoG [Pirellulaceae bacterium]
MSTSKVARPPGATSEGLHVGESLLKPEEHVLATLEADGSRRWLFPRLAQGDFWSARRSVAYALIAFFTILPHLRFYGKPPVLLDIPTRRFTIMGYTFLPTDTLLLALLMVSGFVSIFLVTALFGRVWCGWGCPQTVYMEFLFRPIDRLFEGTVGKGGQPAKRLSGWRWWARAAVYLAVCAFLTHTFLAYFVGTDRLGQWVTQSPWEHPIPFLIMAVSTILLVFNFIYFREQTCLIACPYGRFQSVMLDRRSLIVTYDHHRGEPRGHGKPVVTQGERTKGDCVDCNKCVQVCPTGIDIRNGLQMECIHCAQCIDACHDVMVKLHMPTGLIRYSNQDSMEHKPSSVWRPRLIIYPVVLLITLSAFMVIFLTKKDFDAKLLRNLGGTFSVSPSGLIDNSLKLSLTNRTENPHAYTLSVLSPASAEVRAIETPEVKLAGGEHSFVPILVSAPFKNFDNGRCPVQLKIVNDSGQERIIDYILLGPYQDPSERSNDLQTDLPESAETSTTIQASQS